MDSIFEAFVDLDEAVESIKQNYSGICKVNEGQTGASIATILATVLASLILVIVCLCILKIACVLRQNRTEKPSLSDPEPVGQTRTKLSLRTRLPASFIYTLPRDELPPYPTEEKGSMEKVNIMYTVLVLNL